jgi:hypothetical protein
MSMGEIEARRVVQQRLRASRVEVVDEQANQVEGIGAKAA